MIAFPSHGRSFNKVLSVANTRLRDVFGMEIVELRAKHKIGLAGETLAQTQKGKGRASNVQVDAQDGQEEETQPSTEKRAGELAHCQKCPTDDSQIKYLYPSLDSAYGIGGNDERSETASSYRI